ncbi:MAG: DUF58 domain-containing protein [Spirochaetales bacterium]|nr:DUF58 domain-containing protein [Spirochaetales bacterium]
MNGKYPVKLRAMTIYFFCVFIAFLAGTYFDRFIYMIFFALLLYPVMSFFMLLFTYTNARFSQNFSTEHPVKGENVEYTIHFTNETKLPFPHVNMSFKTITPLMDMHLPEYSVFIKPGGEFKKLFTINCPYRGIYTVGLEKVVIEDLLHFIRFKLKVWHNTFYVYPRILELTNFSPGMEDIAGGDKGLPFGGEPDYAMFDQLKEYREGEAIKHIYWKKFAITGRPYMKQFDTSPRPAVRIYFDLTKSQEKYVSELEIEDTSVEILTALVKYFLDHEIKTSVKAPGREFFNFYGKDAGDFKEFYDSTTNLIFQDTIPLSRLYKIEEKGEKIDSNSIFFITHNLDIDLFNLIQAALGTDIIFTVVFNQSGFSPDKKERNLQFFYSLKNRGARIIVINHSDTIVEELEKEFHE